MNEPDSSKTSGPPRTAGMLEIRAEGSHLNRQLLLPAERFIYSETNSGALLVFFAIVALDVHHWINDGLMAIFFLVVALEIKRAAGWGIPMATDIAFAVAILALLGGRVPSQFCIFLLTFAIIDDVGSILVIAIYYTAHFSLPAMWLAIATLGMVLAMRLLAFRSTLAFVLPAIIFWVAMLKSGVHAAIAGVILGVISMPGWRFLRSLSGRRLLVR